MDIKRLGILIFIISVVLDVMALIFPQVLTRAYISYLPFVGVLVTYLSSVKKIDFFYVMAVCFTLIGIYFYDEIRLELSEIGLIFYMAAIFIFVLKAVDNSEIFTVSNIFLYATLVTVFLGTIIYFLLKNINGLIFYYATLYGVILGALVFLGIINYQTSKNKKNKMLCWSSILFVVNATTASYTLFWTVEWQLRAIELTSFSVAHLLMCFYMLQIDKEKQMYF